MNDMPMIVTKRITHIDDVLKVVTKRIDRISELVGRVIRWICPLAMLILFYSVVCRKAFNAPPIWAQGLSTMLWGVYIIMGACYASYQDAHVRVDFLLKKFSFRTQNIINAITHLLFFAYCIAILSFSVPWAWESFLKQETLSQRWNPPIWPLKMMVPIAVFLLLLQEIATYIRAFYATITGRRLG